MSMCITLRNVFLFQKERPGMFDLSVRFQCTGDITNIITFVFINVTLNNPYAKAPSHEGIQECGERVCCTLNFEIRLWWSTSNSDSFYPLEIGTLYLLDRRTVGPRIVLNIVVKRKIHMALL
jgi:hypothetical protein